MKAKMGAMKAKMGDAEFEAEGDDATISDAFKKWLTMVKDQTRWPLMKKIAELKAQLAVHEELLRQIDEEAPR